jgi:hypothetical protein
MGTATRTPASISFEHRYWTQMPNGYNPQLSAAGAFRLGTIVIGFRESELNELKDLESAAERAKAGCGTDIVIPIGAR